ncbi:MAG TPA: secretin N-terminal domain-containing protein [Kiritimatiellia bacterium]|nr:secretin N-terminal domain-containing protein [Kiritimatiellia bacterium]
MKSKYGISWLLLLGLVLLGATLKDPSAASAQQQGAPPVVSANEPIVTPPPAGVAADGTQTLVTLNVEDTLVSQILNAFSRQTGRSIVIGPEITGRTTVRLTNVPWEQALDSVLKPFGYGYFQDGDTTVVTGVDPLRSRVITLRYLDASDVEPVIGVFLSPRGKIVRVANLGQSWGSTASQSESVAGGEGMGKRARMQEDPKISRSKTLVITDTPEVLQQITAFLDKVDVPPAQILIEARFLELNPRVLRDIGVEFGTSGGFKSGSHTYGYSGNQSGSAVAPGNFNAFSTPTLSANEPFNAGISLAFQRLTSVQYELLFHALQEDASANVLSAPRILTLNNQEAVIIVGTKFPIINSDASSAASGGAATITTSLRGYEDIGIQLNVLPQISDGNMISMIVRPSVRELIGTRSGKTVSGEVTALTEYPVISTREAETQVVLPDGQTIVIGGLLKDRQSKTTLKVPFLGSIPYLGWLFRRETVQNEKIELLIFVTASIVPAEGSELTRAEVDSLAKRPANLLSAPAILANTADASLSPYIEPGLSGVSANAPMPSAPADKR